MFEDYFQSNGLRLYYRFYPVEKAKAVCLALHGHGEHAGRYEKYQRVLQSENISLVIFDYRGQGRSQGQDVYLDSFEDYLADVSNFREFLKNRYGIQEKMIVHGNSLGALIAIFWALENPEKIRGLVLSSPCLGLSLPRPLVAINNWVNRVAPKFIYRNPVYPPHLTHSPDEMLLYQKDPLIKRRISARLVHEMIAWGRKLEGMPRLDFPFPVYLLLAGLEKVVDGNKSTAFFEKINAPDKKFELFPNFYHELFHELDQDLAFAALKSFLELICSKTRG